MSADGGIILGMGAVNGRRRYIVTSCLIRFVHIQNEPCYNIMGWFLDRSVNLRRPQTPSLKSPYVYTITVTSQWARWCFKSPASRLFTQPFIRAQIKENIKAPRHWSLCGQFTSDRWIPAQRASNTENVSIWWRHHAIRRDVTTSTIRHQG